MTWEQANRVIPLVAGIVTVVIYMIATPYVKAAKERKRQAAQRVPTIRPDLVSVDEKARAYNMARTVLILMGGFLLAVVLGFIGYHLFDDGVNSKYRFEYSLMVGGVFVLLWGVVGGVIVQSRRRCDQCPKCGKRRFYYKSDRGKFVSCLTCPSAWRAGSAPV
ncbi:MAG: hypothetical protein QGG42_19020 [Phycisphaerae bacterium]|jgi:hypothetical protein|nr:hypothetical protein [Phycisphaerae bacterium]